MLDKVYHIVFRKEMSMKNGFNEVICRILSSPSPPPLCQAHDKNIYRIFY